MLIDSQMFRKGRDSGYPYSDRMLIIMELGVVQIYF